MRVQLPKKKEHPYQHLCGNGPHVCRHACSSDIQPINTCTASSADDALLAQAKNLSKEELLEKLHAKGVRMAPSTRIDTLALLYAEVLRSDTKRANDRAARNANRRSTDSRYANCARSDQQWELHTLMQMPTRELRDLMTAR